MKNMNASKFRIVLSILIFLCSSLAVGSFVLGYKTLLGVGEETARRQADAHASKDSVEQLQQLERELEKYSSVADDVDNIRTSNSLAQFDTEKSLRTIAHQLGLPIKTVIFVNANISGSGSSKTAPTATATSNAWGSTNSKISFEFDRNLSLNELMRFYHAVENSTPKLRLDSINIPSGSNLDSIEAGTLTIEVATD